MLFWVPANHVALVVPGLLFPGDQLFFPGPPLGKWVFAGGVGLGGGGGGGGGTCLAHWDHLDPSGDGALKALAPGCACPWRAGDCPQTRRAARLPSSPPSLAARGLVTAPKM